VRERDLEGSIDAIPVDRLAALVNGEDHIPAVPTMTADPQQAEVEEDDAGAEGVGPAAGLLALAQKVHDEYVAEGQARYDSLIAEAEALLAEANAEREHMITAARERSTEMVGEARQQRDAMLHDLGSERGLLEKKIEDLRTFERGHRALMKSYLEGQLIELENGGADQTGSDAGN
jgi:cell division septum initiation protein DivIVA